VTCALGTKQALPAGGAKLIEIVRNAAATSAKGAVRLVNREIMDAQQPGWHQFPPTVDILHFMYDARDPQTFYVFPPATTLAQLDIVYSSFPVDVVEPAAGSLYSAVVGNISLPDIFGNVLQDYILYRAYTKDSEYAGNVSRAQAHYAAFSTALGLEVTGTVNNMPASPGNPNTPRKGAPA